MTASSVHRIARGSSVASHLVRTRPPAEPGALSIARRTCRLPRDAARTGWIRGGGWHSTRSANAHADIVRTASLRSLPVGARSSLTGGATPRGEVVLSLTRMRTLGVDGAARIRARGPGDPRRGRAATRDRRAVSTGSDVSWRNGRWHRMTNAAGAATFKCGTTRTDGLTG